MINGIFKGVNGFGIVDVRVKRLRGKRNRKAGRERQETPSCRLSIGGIHGISTVRPEIRQLVWGWAVGLLPIIDWL